MKKTLAGFLALVFLAGQTPAWADNFAWGSSLQGSSPRAKNIRTDTTNFDNNLSAIDVDVQTALETLDELVAGGGSSVLVDGVEVTDPDFTDGGDINFAAAGSTVTATVKADSVALTTDTTGNYVTSVATSSPLSGGAAASEGATLTLSIADADDDGSTKGAATFTDADFDATSGLVSIVSGITRDTEWDTAAEINAATTDGDFGILNATNTWTTTNTFSTAQLRIAGAISGTINFTTASTTGGAWLFPGSSGGTVTATSAWDTIAEIETNIGGSNILLETEIDASSELAALMDDETGSGALTFATSPVFTTNIDHGSAGVRVSDDGDGAITWLGLGDGNDEDLKMNLDDGVGGANTIEFTSSTGVTNIYFTSLDLNVADEAYNATNWNGSTEVPTKNAVRDQFESFAPSSAGGWTDAGTSVRSTTATDNFIIGSTTESAGSSGAGVLGFAAQTAPGTNANLAQLYGVSVSGDSLGVIMLHCNGTDEGTTFTDSSTYGRTMTANGNANTETDQKKFGSASMQLDGNDSVSAADAAEFDFGTNDFSYDLWIRISSDADAYLITRTDGIANGTDLLRSVSVGGLRLYVQGVLVSQESWSPSTNTWYHIEASRTSGYCYIFADGTKLGTQDADSTSVSDSDPYVIGAFGTGGTSGFNGYIDEVRIGQFAGHTSNFTPKTSEYSSDPYTELTVKDGLGNATTLSPHNMAGIPDSRMTSLKERGHVPVTIHHKDAAGNEEWVDLAGMAVALEKLTGKPMIFSKTRDFDWREDKKNAAIRATVRDAIKGNWGLVNLAGLSEEEIDRRAMWIYEKARREASFQAARVAAGNPVTAGEKPPAWLQAVVDEIINRVE